MNKESLCNLHLVSQLLADPHVTRVPRAIDKSWFYANKIGTNVNGFNPFAQMILYGKKSFFASWLAAPQESARDYNEGDFLVKEVLFAVHDYLHLWAYRAIQALLPELGFGAAPIRRDNIEQFVFCHLLTEAVATVGLDYWFLSTFQLDRLVPIGTKHRTLTTSYHEDDLEEFRRFCPDLVVQHPSFLVKLCEFYCSGVFLGFDIADLRRSPKTLAWLQHELSYGVLQRKYSRMWLRYLSSDEICYCQMQLRAAVDIDQPWQRKLMADVADLLWEKVKLRKLHDFPSATGPTECWRSAPEKPLDFRFINVNCIDLGQAITQDALLEPEASFSYLFWQYISQHDFSRFDKELLTYFDKSIKKRSFKSIQSLLLHQPRLQALPGEPRDMLVLN